MSAKKFRGLCSTGCGNLIKAGATKYCSFKCLQEFRHRERALLLESGNYIAMQVTPFLRRYLIARLGERCSRCGWAKRHATTKKVPIEVEHLDGDWQNYHLENLTLLCPNCHALTPTFRGLNRGRGRGHRLGGRDNPIRLQPSAVRAKPTERIKEVLERPLQQLPLLPPT